jgi:urease accessory protein
VDGTGIQLQGGWRARLELAFEYHGERTTLARRRHVGPLGVQRPCYPEGSGTCHVHVLHPPGGLVAGDSLELDVTLDPGARALLTTPAATKLYRSVDNQRGAEQQQRFRIGAGARLEWLPQETIAYAGARVRLATRVELEPGAELVAMEILCLGRPANAERFERGRIAQRIEVWRDGAPLLLERALYQGGGRALDARFGLGGLPVVGALVCIGPARSEPVHEELRATLAEHAPGEAAVTELASALVCRYRGGSVERAQRALRGAWTVLRRGCFAQPAVAPRIWAT